jgi:hypothetical protein
VYTSKNGTKNCGAACFLGQKIRPLSPKKTHRSAEFGNRNFSIFGRATEQKWEAQLEFPVVNLS